MINFQQSWVNKMPNTHADSNANTEELEAAPLRPMSTETSFRFALNNLLDEKLSESRSGRFQILFDAIEADGGSLISFIGELFSRLNPTVKSKFQAAAERSHLVLMVVLIIRPKTPTTTPDIMRKLWPIFMF